MKKILISLIAILMIYLFFVKNPVETDMEISLVDSNITMGDLVLVNREFAIQKDPLYLTEIPTKLHENVQVNSRFLVQQQMVEPLKQMFTAANTDGVSHFIINSAYRSGKLQQQMFDKHGAEFALPRGHSEHQTGLSIDIGSTQGKMDNTLEGKWLEENAARFGFVLRYPANKVDITQIGYEPWHFRYVGLPHSLIMQDEQIVLEEYIELLQRKKLIEKTVNNTNYIVQYTKNEDIAYIPETAHYTISGDNIGGFIITSIVP